MQNKYMQITFNKGQTTRFANAFKIAIPDGYHCNATPNAIANGVELFAVPQSKPLALSSTDSPFYFYIEGNPFVTAGKFDQANLQAYKQKYSSWLMGNIFDISIDIHHVGTNSGINMMYQFVTGETDDFVIVNALIFVKSLAYCAHFTYSYEDVPAYDQDEVMDWFHDLLKTWVTKITEI